MWCRKRNDLGATLPQFVECESFHNGFWEFDDNLVCCSDDFSCDVDKSPSHRIGVAGHRNDVVEDVFLERLEQEEGNEHRVIKCLVLREPFKRKGFEAEIFEGAVREFFGSALVVGFDDPFRRK